MTTLTLKERKHLLVNVPESKRYARDGYTLRFSSDGKSAQVKMSHDIRYEIESSVDKVISMLQKYQNRLDNATIEVEPYNDYGSEAVYITLVGWRVASDEEIERAEQAHLAYQEDQKERKRQEVERALRVIREAGEI